MEQKKRKSYDNLLRRSIIKKLVVDTALPEETIKDVIMHEFDLVVEALRTCKTVEISGFGKFVLMENKAKSIYTNFTNEMNRCIAALENEMPDKERKDLERKIKQLKDKTEDLYAKLETHH